MTLADVLVLALVVASLVAARRVGFAPLRPGIALYAALAALLAVIVAASIWPLPGIPWAADLIAAARYAEYAVLAAAIPLALRRRRDANPLFAAIVVWSGFATLVAVLQFAGVRIFDAWTPGDRQPSFLGVHDFGALSTAALVLALATLTTGAPLVGRKLTWIAAVAGAVGLVVSAAAAAVLGLLLATAAALVLAWRFRTVTPRRLAGVGAIVGAVLVGTLAMRAGDIDQFTRFAGIKPKEHTTTQNVQTYSQRTLLAYFALRMFEDHPVFGVGWEGVKEERNYGPYLADAHRRFPDTAEQAFPSPAHPWRVDNAYLQALAELGLVGLAAFIAAIAAGIAIAARAALRAPPAVRQVATVALMWQLVLLGVYTGQGLVAGIPIEAYAWIAAGLGVAAAAWWKQGESPA